MMRVCTALLVAACCLAGDAPAVLPPAAQTAVDRLEKALAKIEADAARSRSGERQKAVKELERAQSAATKAGDLDAALAVKARIEELRKAEEEDAAVLLGDARPAAKDPAALAVGSWNASKTNGVTGVVEVAADRTVRITAGVLTYNGVWRIEKDRLVISWGGSAQHIENLGFISPDRLVGDSFDAGKDGLTMTRVKSR